MSLWNLVIVILAVLILWWSLTRQASFTETQTHDHVKHETGHGHTNIDTHEAVHEAVPADVLETRTEPVNLASTTDDLRVIEGIGPKISSVLAAAGISTFAVLAATEPEKIKTILSAADERLGRISDPTSWPEQASLAAKGDMESLLKLQDSLKGGRQH